MRSLENIFVLGVLEMSGEKEIGQDVRFLSTLCWVWYCNNEHESNLTHAECIDGETGLIYDYKQGKETSNTSSVSTFQMTLDFIEVEKIKDVVSVHTLADLRNLKRQVASDYETAKDNMLTKHQVFNMWNRRDVL
jgi:hypothetical protein